MHEKRIAVGNQPFEKRLQNRAARPGPAFFLNQQARPKYAANESSARPSVNWFLVHPFFNFARELAKPRDRRVGDRQFMEGLAEHSKVKRDR